MIAAVTLMLAAPDHWGFDWPGGHDHEHAGAAAQATHNRHCHGDAATCSDLPLTGVGGLAALAEWLQLPPTFAPTPRSSEAALPRERFDDVLTPPPRA